MFQGLAGGARSAGGRDAWHVFQRDGISPFER